MKINWRSSWAFQVLALALSYFVFARLGLFLAIPPGYATAIWPPSAIALAFLLRFGYRVWPGIFIGSLVVNFFVSANFLSSTAIMENCLKASGIACGAVLQACVGVYLIHRWIGKVRTLEEEKEIIGLMFLGGPVASVVNATISTSLLLATETITRDNVFITWSTWWVGDAIAVMVLAPAILVMINPSVSLRRRGLVVLPFAIAFTMVVLLFLHESRRELQETRINWNQRPELSIAHAQSESWVVLMIGLSFSAVLSALLLMITGRTAQVETLVEQRTADLTEAQNKVLNQEKKLIQAAKMSALGEMASGMAHEINNPLAVVSMAIERTRELSKNTNGLTIDIREQLDIAETMVYRIAKIIKGLLDFSKDRGDVPFQTERVAALIENTLDLCREKFEKHKVNLYILEIPPDLSIVCQASQISKMLLSLLSNSYEAVVSAAEKWIKIEVLDKGESVLISITDSGPGIQTKFHEKLFQPFFTTKEVGSGIGLGLSIAKGIADSHWGSLQFDSDSAHTRFVISLPKKPA